MIPRETTGIEKLLNSSTYYYGAKPYPQITQIAWGGILEQAQDARRLITCHQTTNH